MPVAEAAPFHVELPFRVWRTHPKVMAGTHMHTDIEANLFLSGGARYFMAGRFHEMSPGRLIVFWAGMPHRMTQVAPDTEFFCLTLPLGWFLAWGIGGGFRERLLDGEPLSDDGDGGRDTALLETWVTDLAASDDADAQRIVLLELEARLRRMARSVTPSVASMSALPTRNTAEKSVESGYVERMASFLARHYAEPLTSEDIARAAELHPNYAMTVFRQGCGISLWEYVTRLRVSHGQRLLLTTDWTVERIAGECGFGSSSRFFAAFRRLCGCTPRAYRLRG